ncbi:hypothetical protein FSP39_013257 [Pinctada imbricata]|uniref:G-protein coupled receptors family 1 profile domain-containing protein n=1 Tax=Pinctada imbricata TaxID=66713 RepID=A0AA88XM76_PINIB|nr:hypothetical protein FSP39_013257 [Pinctada imbricata]
MEFNASISEEMKFKKFNEELSWLRSAEYQEFLDEYLPVLGFLLLLCVMGTIGNIHVLFVYKTKYKPSNHRTFILCLAAVDLFSCIVSIPFEIFDMRYRYTFSQSWCCGVFRMLNHVGSIGSGFLLGVIALERYRKACTPMKTQISLLQARIACFVTLFVSTTLSIPAMFLYGSNYTDSGHPGIFGMDCTVLSHRYIFFKIYSGLLLIATTSVFIICIVAYIFIGKVLFRQMKFRNTVQLSQKKKSLVFNDSVVSSECASSRRNLHKIASQLSLDMTTEGNIVHDDESSFNNDHLRVNPRNSQVVTHRKKVKFDRSKRITLMFLVATSISYVSYLPNMVISVIKALDTDSYDILVTKTGAFAFILLRLYFLSNITNPIVYSFMDDRFRSELKKMYTGKCSTNCKGQSSSLS